MRSFSCATCGQLVFFENTVCLRCGSDARLRAAAARAGHPERARRAARTSRPAGCNWLVGAPGELCASCRLTRTRPADDDAEGVARFRDAEAAKRWLLFELGELGLPVQSWREREGGLAFELLSSERAPVTTGHADGVITLDVAESDDAHREALREQLGEPYRTVLGHFRHEVGHYYWPLLVAEDGARERCRELFGDEREDYGAALERHYETGPPADWSRALRQRLRDDAPVGGLGGDLRPLPAHLGHAADRRRLRRPRGAARSRRPTATASGPCWTTGCR